MGEKRKPALSILLKKQGKHSQKIEFFNASDFCDFKEEKYRLRINGKWFPLGDRQFFGSYQVRDMFWKELHKILNK